MLIESTLTDAKINQKYTILLLMSPFSLVYCSVQTLKDLSDYVEANITLPVMEDSQDDSDLDNDSDESIAQNTTTRNGDLSQWE